MQVNNNVQSPNFGMALKLQKGSKEALKKLPMETIEKLQKAGEDLKDTQLEILKYCDVLVDGPYVEELRDITLPFRGSSNQKIYKLH